MKPIILEKIEKILNEMPHVSAPNKTGAFDLGLELLQPRTPEVLVNYISRIFSGKTVFSRMGRDKEIELKLDTPEKKNEFWNDLKNDIAFPNYIIKYFGINIDQLEELLMASV